MNSFDKKIGKIKSHYNRNGELLFTRCVNDGFRPYLKPYTNKINPESISDMLNNSNLFNTAVKLLGFSESGTPIG